METWTPAKPKGEDAGNEDGDPRTPATGRSKKTATPSTAGTGAGVKKRASTSKKGSTTPGSRSRKVKSQALVKAEDDESDDMMEDEEMGGLDTPTKKPGPSKTKAKAEPAKGPERTALVMPSDYTNFPDVLPEPVLQRQAILANLGGTWIISPVHIDTHTQWLARLPAHIQSQFYTQSTASGKFTAINKKNFTITEDDQAAAQLLTEQYNAAAAAAAAATNARPAQAGEFDLSAVPMHPSYVDQAAREDEGKSKNHASLFGRPGGM